MRGDISFSVLMSVYYKDNPIYLKEALESIEFQTLKPNEIILVKDGPLTAELEDVISNFTTTTNISVKTISLEKNMGLGNALRIGLKSCNYEYIGRMDADDINIPNRFYIQMKVILEGNFDIVGSVVKEFRKEGNKNIILGFRKVPEFHDEIVKFAKKRNPMNHPSVLFKKSSVIAAGNYVEIKGFEDYYLWVRMILNGAKFYNIQKPLLNFRVNNETYLRRGGWNYLKSELNLRKEFLKLGFITNFEYYSDALLRTAIRIAPNKLRNGIYKMFLRARDS